MRGRDQEYAGAWLHERYRRAEQERAEAAEAERAAFGRWQEAMAVYDAARDASAEAWCALVAVDAA